MWNLHVEKSPASSPIFWWQWQQHEEAKETGATINIDFIHGKDISFAKILVYSGKQGRTMVRFGGFTKGRPRRWQFLPRFHVLKVTSN